MHLSSGSSSASLPLLSCSARPLSSCPAWSLSSVWLHIWHPGQLRSYHLRGGFLSCDWLFLQNCDRPWYSRGLSNGVCITGTSAGTAVFSLASLIYLVGQLRHQDHLSCCTAVQLGSYHHLSISVQVGHCISPLEAALYLVWLDVVCLLVVFALQLTLPGSNSHLPGYLFV